MAISALLPIVFFAILISVALYLINQQLTEQKISDYSWQFDTIQDGSLRFNHVDFIFNNQLDIHLENIHFSEADSSIKKERFPFFSANKISIGLVKIVVLNKPQNPIKNDRNPTLQATLKALTTQLQTIQSRPEWLAFLPQKVEIASFMIQAPCSDKSCSVKGSAGLQLLNTQTDIQAKGHFKLHDKEIVSPHMQSQFLVKIPSRTQEVKAPASNTLVEYSLESEIKTDTSTTSLMQFSQTGKLTNQQELSVSSHFAGLLPSNKQNTPDKVWQNLQNIYQNWSGHSLELDSIRDYLPLNTSNKDESQAVKRPSNLDFEIALNAFIQLNSLENINDKTTVAELLKTIEFSGDSKAQFNAPFPIPSLGSIQGTINAALALKKGEVQSYHLAANGHFQRSLVIPLLDYQKTEQLKDFTFLASTTQKQQTDINKLKKLPFTLSIKSNPPTKSSATLQTEGMIQLGEKPNLNINKGSLNFSKVNLALTHEQLLKAQTGELLFTGELKSSAIHLDIPKLNLIGDYQDKNQNLALNNTQIGIKNLSLKSEELHTFLDKLEASAQSIHLKTDLSYSPKDNQKIFVKKMDAILTKSKLEPKTASNKAHSKQFTSQYIVKTALLEQQNIQPLSWTLQGKIKSELLPTLSSINQLNLQGSISNQAGLVVFHNAFYKPTHLYADWELPNIYFLAGNPLQKTFKDWPKLLTLGSGQLKAKGNSQLNLSAQNNKTSLLNTLNTKAEITLQGISGIYNETTLNQIDSHLNLSLKRGVLNSEINKLNLVQVNHGLIFGPVVFSGNYQTSIDSLLRGKLKLTQFNAQLFNGQAWLKSQTFDLSQRINSQLHLSHIDLKALLEQYPSAEIQGSGIIGGNLPFSIDLIKPPFFTLDKGIIQADSSGGKIQYHAASGLKQTHQSMKLVFSVLEDFHYSVLDSNVTYGADKKLHLKLHLQGQNPSVENGRQVNFNIQLEEDLPALITTMQLSNQVSETIKKRIQEKLQQ